MDTCDTFFDGRITIRQSKTGYRFSIDAVLLAWHVRLHPRQNILDLGTGCGIIPLILAFRKSKVRIFGIEIQTELADLARLNVSENRLDDRITILCQDLRTLTPDIIPCAIDTIVCNPPYRKAESGRINPDLQRAIARHEIEANLNDLVAAARRFLPISGKLVTIYPAERLTDMLHHLRVAELEPKILRMIHSHENSGARLFIVEGIRGGNPGLTVAPPLIIYKNNGEYTDEVQAMFTLDQTED